MCLKTSRAASLTPEDLEFLGQYSSTTTGSIHPYLSSLVNYIHPVSFSGFDEAESKFKLCYLRPVNMYCNLLQLSPYMMLQVNLCQQSNKFATGVKN